MKQSPGGRIWWTSDVRDSNEPFLPADSPVRSFLVAPLKFSGETVGLLEVLGSEAHAFSLQEIHLVDVIGGQIGVAVKNARLHEKQVQAETAELNLRQQLLAHEKRSPASELVQGVVSRVEGDVTAAQDQLATIPAKELETGVAAGLETARAALARAARVLDEFRALHAEPASAPRPVSVDGVLAACLERRRGALDEAKAEVSMRIDPSVPPVMGEADDLERLFVTLLDQALAARAKHIDVSLTVELREVVVIVEDDGPPIGGSELAHVFEPFQAVRGSVVGGGLALAVATSIVRRHAATIEVQRAGDKNRFIVRFPLLAEARASASGARGASDDLASSGIR